MNETIALGASPLQEDDIMPIGTIDYYLPKQYDQNLRYLRFLNNRFAYMLLENDNVKLRIELFGSEDKPFFNVVVEYDADDEIQASCAKLFSENLPKTWEDKDEFYVCL